MTEETIERVARALYDDEFGQGAWADLLASAKWGKLTRPTATERKYLQRARAAIEALRPTEQMKKAGAKAVEYNSMIDEGEIAAMWRAMIDAALANPPKDGTA
jgi:hypothetical protein